jgi:hypothetical protein
LTGICSVLNLLHQSGAMPGARLMIVVVLLMAATSDLAAQMTSGPTATSSPAALSLASAVSKVRWPLPAGRESARSVQPAPRSSSRDSLVNGAIVGAIVGGVGLGAFGGVICQIEHEPGTDSCIFDVIRIGAIGAAIGAGAGLAVDAALSRQGGIALTFRRGF